LAHVVKLFIVAQFFIVVDCETVAEEAQVAQLWRG